MKTDHTTALIAKDGFEFRFDPEACRTCGGKCCNGGSGYIFVTQKELVAIAKFMGVKPAVLVRKYTRKVGYRFSFKEIQSGDNFACIFYDTSLKRCGIYPVRPRQCRTFPFWNEFREHPEFAAAECPGVICSPESA